MQPDLHEMEGKKLAFVCSGGVVKAAAWHLGVALALKDLGFTFKNNTSTLKTDVSGKEIPRKLEISTYVGSSAGALVGCYLASGFSPEDVINATINNKKTHLKGINYKDILYLKRPMKKPPQGLHYAPFEEFPYLIRKLLRPLAGVSGLFSTLGISKYLEKNVLFTNDFSQLDADLFIVATQLDHSRKVIFGKFNYPNPTHDSTATYYTGTSITDAAAASMSVPPFFSPYPIKNRQTNKIDYYIDGEIRETLSTHVAIDNQCDYVISSWTHTPYHYHDEIGSLINYGLPAICIQAIYLLIQKKIVSSRAQRNTAKDIINTVNDYMKAEKISSIHRKNILDILERKLNYKAKATLIDIYPKHQDYQLFFSNFFSLNPEVSAFAVRMGYKRTLEIFKEKTWLK